LAAEGFLAELSHQEAWALPRFFHSSMTASDLRQGEPYKEATLRNLNSPRL
jgi:hypothetical protein